MKRLCVSTRILGQSRFPTLFNTRANLTIRRVYSQSIYAANSKQRIELWNKEFQQQHKDVEVGTEYAETPISFTINDGDVVVTAPYKLTFPVTVRDLLKKLSKLLPCDADDVLICRLQNKGPLLELSHKISSASDVNDLHFYTFSSKEGREVFWHSSSHILGSALEQVFDDVKLCDGPALQTNSEKDLNGGFFYECKLPPTITINQDHYQQLEKKMKQIIQEAHNFEKLVVDKEFAKELFRYNPFKLEILDRITDSHVTLYRSGDLIDLCRGPHLYNTKLIKAVQIFKHSGTNQHGQLLQRAYGISYPNQKSLLSYQERSAAAAKRDHRVIGRQQDLLMFHEMSPGTAFFLPNGTIIFENLINFIRTEYRKRGYNEVISPQLYDKKLWVTSGHWENYKEDMFVIADHPDGSGCSDSNFTQALKPMNCPGHCLMFLNKSWSFRDLPVRYADFSPLHRNEVKGALSGLTRVRRFHQDDAHIFCTRDQVSEEIRSCIDFIKFVYEKVFDFQLEFKLSTRPFEKFVGEIELWNQAENSLKECLDFYCGPKGYTINEGDGAFYGPKIDVVVKDCLDRSHQLATVQLDFQLPQRFNLKYQTSSEGIDTPVMIHRAVLGSVERFIAILTEHCGGRWPLWLSPRQVMVCCVSEAFSEYAKQVASALNQMGRYHVNVDHSDRTLKKKIREAQEAQYNYIIVVGKGEQDSNTVNVRSRDGSVVGTMSLEEFEERLKSECSSFK
ncbi:threonyl tRS [Acrasis kona]|uniref:threonine--tRNA ligase n=1 Tax=Acrasis kona TaxID=1008807 RepID=A0AAW2YS34_9EUKA